MLARYKLYRGAHPPHDPKPEGVRQLTTHNSRHCLRPSPELVEQYLDETSGEAWRAFARAYRALVQARFDEDRAPFDELAELAMREDVYLGCWCPTKRQPDVRRCHTWLALEFMKKQYPRLKVVFPGEGGG